VVSWLFACNANTPACDLTAPTVPQLSTTITHLRDALGDQAYESLARKGETMTTAAMVTYAYDQIDQARAELEPPATATVAGANTSGSATSSGEAPPIAGMGRITANSATNGRDESPRAPSAAHARTAANSSIRTKLGT
jgi:hypothetical protein